MSTLLAAQTLTAETYDVYFGTYTHDSPSKGIYHSTLNSTTGELTAPELACELSKPSFIAIHPSGKYIYSVTEGDPGIISALLIDQKSKKLTLINQSASGGKGPCHVSISDNGRTLLAANYASGSIASIPVNNDGSLGKAVSIIQHEGKGANKRRQQGPHAHSCNFSPDNRYVYAADLGIDKIMIYKVDPKSGELTKNDPPFFTAKQGAGPRHFTFHPNGEFAYLINELDNTIMALSYNGSNGALKEIQTISTLPADFKGKNLTAEVKVHPNGKFLYGSNRGDDSIAIYDINQKNGKLTLVGFQNSGIDEPRNFNIDPSGKYCIVGNQDTNSVLLFKVDDKTGKLIPTGVSHPVGKPICVKFLKRE